MFNKIVLVFFLCIVTFISSELNAVGLLGSPVQSKIESELNTTGTTGSVIDLNVRIEIPDQYRRDKNENPVTMIGNVPVEKLKGVTLWGTLVRPKDDPADAAAGRITKAV
jgi:hypothetical protein